MTDIEKLALMQAIYNEIGREIATRDPDNLRGRVNESYLRLYEQTGATGFEVRVNGKKVGTYGFPKVKAQPARQESTVEVVDWDALSEWEDDEFDLFCRTWVARNIEVIARDYFEQTGVLPDGMAIVERDIPAIPEGIKQSGTMRVQASKVAEAMGPALGEAVRGLLEGGEG